MLEKGNKTVRGKELGTDGKTLLSKLESVQKPLSSVVERLEQDESVSSQEIIKVLQAAGEDIYLTLLRIFNVAHIGREGNLAVTSEWAIQADIAEALSKKS